MNTLEDNIHRRHPGGQPGGHGGQHGGFTVGQRLLREISEIHPGFFLLLLKCDSLYSCHVTRHLQPSLCTLIIYKWTLHRSRNVAEDSGFDPLAEPAAKEVWCTLYPFSQRATTSPKKWINSFSKHTSHLPEPWHCQSESSHLKMTQIHHFSKRASLPLHLKKYYYNTSKKT